MELTKFASVLADAPTLAENIDDASASIANMVFEGEVDALKMAVKIEAMQRVLDRAKELIGSSILEQAEKEMGSGKTIELYGATITIMETGVKYDYTESEKWNRINEDIKVLTEARKAEEEKYKSACELSPYIDERVDEATGELVKVEIPYPPARKSTTAVSVKIKGATKRKK